MATLTKAITAATKAVKSVVSRTKPLEGVRVAVRFDMNEGTWVAYENGDLRKSPVALEDLPVYLIDATFDVRTKTEVSGCSSYKSHVGMATGTLTHRLRKSKGDEHNISFRGESGFYLEDGSKLSSAKVVRLSNDRFATVYV